MALVDTRVAEWDLYYNYVVEGVVAICAMVWSIFWIIKSSYNQNQCKYVMQWATRGVGFTCV